MRSLSITVLNFLVLRHLIYTSVGWEQDTVRVKYLTQLLLSPDSSALTIRLTSLWHWFRINGRFLETARLPLP